MSVTSLILCPPHDLKAAVAPDGRGVLRIEGERPWAVVGRVDLVDVALEDLRDVARRVHPDVLHLGFKNAVGVFRVRGLGTLEVVSGKWDETHFDAMMADVARIGSALPFAAGSGGPLPYDRTISADKDVLYHAYVYIRHILGPSAPLHVRLMPALRAILAEPHQRSERKVEMVAPDRLQRVDDDTILAIARGGGPLVRVPAHRVPAVLQGHLPRLVPERQYRTTIDTPENRFVKCFLDQIDGVLSRMSDALAKDDGFAARTRGECGALADLLAPISRHPMWRSVGTMTQLPASSVVLQRRRGYRDVYRHFVLLRLATSHLPISAHEARGLLESKDIARLYELWCYFRVVEVLDDILGPPVQAVVASRGPLQADVSREFEVRWAGGVRALYNATFSRSKPTGRATYSLPLRPDVALLLPDGTVHVLDAKFRLEWSETTEDEVDQAMAKADDLYKMHTYRDAIRAARSAWVLYPGTGTTPDEYPSGVGGAAVDGVGAIPLRPEANGGQALESVMRRLVQ